MNCGATVDEVHFVWPHPFISKETALFTIFKQDGLMQSNSHNLDLLTFAGREVFPSRVNYLVLNRMGKIIEFLHRLEMIKTGKNNEIFVGPKEYSYVSLPSFMNAKKPAVVAPSPS